MNKNGNCTAYFIVNNMLILNYELINLEWCFEYNFVLDREIPMVRDDGESSLHERGKQDQEDELGIPFGKAIEDIKKREAIVKSFFDRWRLEHPEQKVFNQELQEDILVRAISVIEAKEHSSKSYESTRAVLELDTVLSQAKKVAETRTKPTDKNQKEFDKIIIMSHQLEGVGRVKLSVGVRHRSKDKIEYGLTVPPPEKDFIDTELLLKNAKKKKKK